MFKQTQIHLTKSHLFGTSCQSYHLILMEFMKKWQNLPKNLKQQLEHVRLQKKIAFNKYQSQQRHKISQDQDIYLPGTCIIMGDSILNGLIEENISKQHNVRIRKFPGATVDDLMYIQLFAKNRKTSLSTKEQVMPPVQDLGKFYTNF